MTTLTESRVRWPAWIHSSLDKFMKDTFATTGLAIYSMTDKQPVPQVPQRIEFNWTGPNFFQPSSNSFVVNINLVVLVTTIPNNVDAYLAFDDQGVGMLGTPACIPVYRYGSKDGDDESQLGTLVRQDPVREYMVGHQEQTNRILQVGITANYRMTL